MYEGRHRKAIPEDQVQPEPQFESGRDDQVGGIAEHFTQDFNNKLEEEIGSTIARNGGLDEIAGMRDTVWAQVRHASSVKASHEAIVDGEVWEGKGLHKGEDIFENILLAVHNDMGGGFIRGRLQAPIDKVDFNAGGDLEEALRNGDIKDDQAKKAEEVVRTLLAVGRCKLASYGSSKQLETASKLLQHCAERLPSFNPMHAGLQELLEDIESGLIALEIDKRARPNLDYSEPGRNNIAKAYTVALRRVAHTIGEQIAERPGPDTPATYIGKHVLR